MMARTNILVGDAVISARCQSGSEQKLMCAVVTKMLRRGDVKP